MPEHRAINSTDVDVLLCQLTILQAYLEKIIDGCRECRAKTAVWDGRERRRTRIKGESPYIDTAP